MAFAFPHWASQSELKEPRFVHSEGLLPNWFRMLPVLFLVYVVAVRVFKKTAPNGKLTVYLGKRDFVDHLNHVDAIDGVIVVDEDYLNGRKVFGHITTTFRYGREEDEVMGVRFSKELYLVQDQIFPEVKKRKLSGVQERLVKKLGPNAFPFSFELPNNAPCSVTLQPGGNYEGKPLGVQYELKTYVSENVEEKPQKRNSVGMAIRKVQYAPPTMSTRQPHSSASKGFALSPGRVQLELSLEKDMFYHNEQLVVHVTITNHSKKSVRSMKVGVVQTCELTMVNSQYSRQVAGIETKEGCPVTPGASLSKVFYLTPVASSNKDRRGIALDGRLKDEDTNLASSTLFANDRSVEDAVGIVISYAVRVRLNLGSLGGEVVADLPFKLMHPEPGYETQKIADKRESFANQKLQQQSMDIVFEDFARLRMSVDEE